MRVALLLSVVLCCCAATASAQSPSVPATPDALVARFEEALRQRDARAFRTLFEPGFDAEGLDSLTRLAIRPNVTRVVQRERDRAPLFGVPAGEGYRLIVELFLEEGAQAGIYTLRLDIRRSVDTPTAPPAWTIRNAELLTSVDGLFRLHLNRTRQFEIRNLEIASEDFVLAIPTGQAFVSETPGGVTGLVVLGPGEMRFTPEPEAERGQVRIFSGRESLVAPFTHAFIRLNPAEFEDRVRQDGLVPRSVDLRDLARAEAVFLEDVAKSFTLDLRELTPDAWSLVPGYGDFIAEVRTRKHGQLTYARSTGEPEDITLFDRRRRRNISVYPSRAVREARGRAYNEDQLADYDILDYDIEATFNPTREWLEGRARVKLRIRSYALATITLKLHEALVVRSVFAEDQGRLLAIRVRDQNSLIVNLPRQASRDDVLVLRVLYAGRIPPLPPDREVMTVQDRPISDSPVVAPEPRYVFSNRSFWYPQGSVTDFATARLRLAVPAPYSSLATGTPVSGSPAKVAGARPGEPMISVSEFVAGQPVRYLSWLITQFLPTAERVVAIPNRPVATASNGHDTAADAPATPGVRYEALDLSIVANPRQVNRGRAIADDVQAILTFYAGLVGDLPYPTFTLALVDNDLPGGHSPAYFAMLYQPLPTTPFVWRNDPVFFDNFPQFFMAHELAHQFWGQAVGWKSYHEQWISEAFAQYFAALYAETRSPQVFRGVLRRMRRSVFDNANQGPITLGYRLGHIQGDSRVFRAILYNKGALVLHMLRQLVGDETFFAGIRALYESARFTKIGTDEVRATFERVTGQSLDTFFERWVHEAALPTVQWAHRTEGGELVLAFTQDAAAEAPFTIPVPVTITYADGSVDQRIVPLSESSAETRLPLRGTIRSVDVDPEGTLLARFRR